VDMAFDRVVAQRPGDGKVSMSEFERLRPRQPMEVGQRGAKDVMEHEPGSMRSHNASPNVEKLQGATSFSLSVEGC
jgi:hypothetical protein